ncbi:MAG: PEP-CTERM sorting domain-containing protein [Nitrospiraceae bacterium]|nr:MAG: PEP-CTERM sorting domain-containing protein [Nitrospiraceae bacterium]
MMSEIAKSDEDSYSYVAIIYTHWGYKKQETYNFNRLGSGKIIARVISDISNINGGLQMKNIRRGCLVLIIAIILSAGFQPSASASTLFLNDWGVSPGNWQPTQGPSNVAWTSEDYTGTGPGFVSPGWGGQPFDTEAAYIGFKNSRMYIAIVTGLPQEGSKDPWRYNNPLYGSYDWSRSLEKYWYDPGDLGIDLGGDGTYEYAISTRTTNIHSTHTPTPGVGKLLSGNLVWENPRAWNYNNNYEDWDGISDPWAVAEYDNAAALGDNFSYAPFGEGHYAIEAIIDTSLIGLTGGELLSLHWVMECGNDNIHLLTEVPANVPEPSTILLVGSGCTALFFYRRRLGRKP